MRVESIIRLLRASFDDASPGAVIAVQTFGDYQIFNPHLHVIATDGCFNGSGDFAVGPGPQSLDLEAAFRLEVMLKKEGKITDSIIENMMGWHHSGFSPRVLLTSVPFLKMFCYAKRQNALWIIAPLQRECQLR